MTPRDANYIGDEFHTCLVRPELISLFQRAKNRDYATSKMKEFVDDLESKREPEPKVKDNEELTEEKRL